LKLKVDHPNDTLYLRLDESAIVESEEVQTGVILDYDGSGQVVGMEMLNLSLRIDPEQLRMVQLEMVG
jgi:uncharacterized protein YuzE